jgi:hypothetical protein
LHQPDRAARCVPRRVLPSCPLAIRFDQPRTWKKRAWTVQLLPAARRRATARCLACDPCDPCHPRTGSAFAESIVVDRVHCLADRAAELLRSANPTPPTALAAVPACDTHRVPVCACLSTRATVAICPAIPVCVFFRPRPPSSFVQGCVRFGRDHIPPPPSPFNPPRCVGLHATVPASCAERVRPCALESSCAEPDFSDCLPYTSPLCADLGKTARKPNRYRVSMILCVDHRALDLIQKKAASVCGR